MGFRRTSIDAEGGRGRAGLHREYEREGTGADSFTEEKCYVTSNYIILYLVWFFFFGIPYHFDTPPSSRVYVCGLWCGLWLKRPSMSRCSVCGEWWKSCRESSSNHLTQRAGGRRWKRGTSRAERSKGTDLESRWANCQPKVNRTVSLVIFIQTSRNNAVKRPLISRLGLFILNQTGGIMPPCVLFHGLPAFQNQRRDV